MAFTTLVCACAGLKLVSTEPSVIRQRKVTAIVAVNGGKQTTNQDSPIGLMNNGIDPCVGTGALAIEKGGIQGTIYPVQAGQTPLRHRTDGRKVAAQPGSARSSAMPAQRHHHSMNPG